MGSYILHLVSFAIFFLLYLFLGWHMKSGREELEKELWNDNLKNVFKKFLIEK